MGRFGVPLHRCGFGGITRKRRRRARRFCRSGHSTCSENIGSCGRVSCSMLIWLCQCIHGDASKGHEGQSLGKKCPACNIRYHTRTYMRIYAKWERHYGIWIFA